MLVAINNKMHDELWRMGRHIRGSWISEEAFAMNTEPPLRRKSSGFCLHFQLQGLLNPGKGLEGEH
jgi:hypothetical protein